ncbi:MAG: guanylate kinase [Persephonella sp.]|nr:MAG: guanylate kinase [Persephonella sp.]
MKGSLIILSAPSGAGKTTIERFLLKEIPNLVKVITCTTRKPRKDEKNGVDYIFLSNEEFEKRIKEEKFLEYALVHGRYYGTPKDEVIKEIDKGNDVILTIDVQGALYIKDNFSKEFDITTIFILPPSIDELIKRLKSRGEAEDEINMRLNSLKKEIPMWKHYDYLVINEDLEVAKESVKNIILSQRFKTNRFDLDSIKDEKLKELMK